MTMEPPITADHTLLFTGERNGPQLMLFVPQKLLNGNRPIRVWIEQDDAGDKPRREESKNEETDD